MLQIYCKLLYESRFATYIHQTRVTAFRIIIIILIIIIIIIIIII